MTDRWEWPENADPAPEPMPVRDPRWPPWPESRPDWPRPAEQLTLEEGGPMHPDCAFCGQPVAERYPYEETVGWVHRRAAGGTNHTVIPRATGRVAHAVCIDKEKRVGTAQADLFDGVTA